MILFKMDQIRLTALAMVMLCFFTETFGAKPPAPQYTLESTTPTSFTIDLTPPSVSGIRGYKVQYQEIGGKKKEVTIGAVTEYTIDGLKPLTAYRARIFTKSTGGNGKFGGWKSVATMDDAPPPVIPEAPQNLAANPTTTSASVTWEAPSDNSAEITGYKLTYGTLDNPTANTVNLDPTPMQTQLDELTDNTQYRLSLLAYNADGESSPVSADFQTTRVTPQPPNFSLFSATPTSITISITPPAISDWSGYTMQWSKVVEGKKKLETLGAVTEYTLEGLVAATTYRVRLLTKSRSGSSKYSDWQNVATMEDAPPTTPEPVAPIVPEAPQHLAADPTTTSASVTWETPKDNGAEITGYRLTYGTLDNPTANTVNLDPTPTQTQLDELMDNTQYRLSLLAYNADGESSPVSVDFQTMQAKPQPPNFSLSSASPTSIIISITPPAISDWSGYTMHWSKVSGGKKKLQRLGAVTEYTLEGLVPATTYRIRMQTRTLSGKSKFSGWVNGATVEYAPPPPGLAAPIIPEAPQNLVADPMTTSASVTWNAPGDNGAEIRGYKLTYGTLDNPTASTVNVDPSPTETELDGLTDNTQYRIYLVAYNADGESDPITVDFQTLEEKLPPPAVEILQSSTKETAIDVTWTLPETTTANAIGHISVSFGEYGTPLEDLQTSDFASNTVTFTAEQLLPATRYTVSVVTVNQQGRSEPVMTIIETLAPAPDPTNPPPPPPEPTAPEVPKIPNTPQNLRATSITEISARLIWEKPIGNGADITGYVLSYGPMNDPVANTQTLPVSPTQFDLYGLQTDVRFNVYVTAYNRKGQSNPADIEFTTSSGRTVPPPVENVQFYPQQHSIYFSWILPRTTSRDEVNIIRFGIGPYGTAIDYLPMISLDKDSHTYTAVNLTPGTFYTVAIFTQNSEGAGEPVTLTVNTDRPIPVPTRPPPQPDKGYVGHTPPAPVELTATVLDPTTIKVNFVDPTIQGRNYDERYYTLRYKKEEDNNYQYMNVRETPYTLEYLTPEATYQIDVKTVIDRHTQSPFTDKAYVFTGEKILRDVTAVQLMVTGPGRIKAIINWIPPENPSQQITGYVLEYTEGYYVTSRSEFKRILIDGDMPKATIEGLNGDSPYHVRVAPRHGSGIGRFSDPPDAFFTPPVPVAGQPLHCDITTEGLETKEQILQRVSWMEGRAGMIGVPLPYCDDYYGVHECHGSVCFCIPGKAPHGAKSCSGGAPGTRPYGDDPNASGTDAPCYAEYESAREAIDEATKTGKPLIEARLPYCTEDGYYQSKQCLGSMCYCTTREGKHTGKEAPIWEAKTLVC
ncbi:fibronectin-like [Amphiura filiformis]|uniref:fibronectin-like n=1 Tax=Amphiura filiformis TaxID=82378 RepID=UPI003B21395E